MPTTLPGVPARSGGDPARSGRTGPCAVRRGGDGVRQGRARRHRDRSRAVLHGRDHDPSAAAIRVARKSRARAGTLELGRRAAAAGARSVWPKRRRRTTGGAGRASWTEAVRLPGWTSAWTAPARARMDMMATGVRTPVGLRIVAPDPHRLDASATALRAVVARRPRNAQRRLRSRSAARRGCTFDADPPRWRVMTSTRSSFDSTADLLTTGGQIGETRARGPANARAHHAASLRMCARAVRPISFGKSRCAPRRRTRGGGPAGAAGAAGASRVRQAPAGAAQRARRARCVRLTSILTEGTDSRLRRAGTARRRCGVRHRARTPLRSRGADRVDGAVQSARSRASSA